jgi:hypothetical protein
MYGMQDNNFQCPKQEGGNVMSHHHHHHVEVECERECCYPQTYGMGGYGMTGGYGGYGTGYTGWGIRWIYALLILIVIVLQFGRNLNTFVPTQVSGCPEGTTEVGTTGFGAFGFPFNRQLIDNSVLFIIVVFLLVLCAGCWWSGGSGGCGSGSY